MDYEKLGRAAEHLMNEHMKGEIPEKYFAFELYKEIKKLKGSKKRKEVDCCKLCK